MSSKKAKESSTSKKRKLTKDEIEDILEFIQPNPHIPTETAAIIVEKAKKSLRTQLADKEIYPQMISHLRKQIQTAYFSTLIQPGESVGIITAQSIGEKQTQSNLNSVDWKEEIIYKSGERIIVSPIGQMIDKYLKDNKENVQYISENRTEYLHVQNDHLYIPSCDENGMMAWYKIEGVTRHLPVGKLVCIRTQSGRSVIVTRGKSLIVWNGKEFSPMCGSDVKVGDILPTTKRLPFLSPQEYVYTTEICSAGIADMNDTEKPSPFAEKIHLDTNFGFLVGIYLANGFCAQAYVCISNGDLNIIARVKDFCDKYNLGYVNRNGTILVNSGILAQLFNILCRTDSKNKIIPEFAYSATQEFILGLIDGYISGNATVDKKTGHIIVSASSKALIMGISTLLSYFGIFSDLSEVHTSKPILDSHTLVIKNIFASLFAEKISITHITKQETLSNVAFHKKYEKNQEKMPDRDIYFDPIVEISEAKGTCQYVYDFTVEKTRNFQLWNGLNVRDTFHKAGSSDKQPVVSKFSELLNTTSKPKAPSYWIYFKTGNTTVPELRQTIGHSLVQLTFKKVVKNWEICIDKEPEDWYNAFFVLYGEKEDTFTDCISMEIDMDVLFEYKLTMYEIAKVINYEYADTFCMFSPDCYGKIDIYFDTRNIELPEEKLVFVTPENTREIYLEEVAQPILENVPLCGISGIMNMFFVQDGKEWIVETENSREKTIDSVKFKSKNKSAGKEKTTDSTKRFKKVLAHPAVDMTRTVSNNVWDIYYTLGVEATRQYMIDEFSKIMDGINICHVMLLVDKMTFTGGISSISRYTMRSEESGPFGKASFEETLDNFLKAGVFGQEEPTRGVSASIICGKRAPIGTGMCDLAMDVQKMLSVVKEESDTEEEDK